MARYAFWAGALGVAVVMAVAGAMPARAVEVTWNTCDGDDDNPGAPIINDCEISVPGPGNDIDLVESPRVHTDPAGLNNNFFTFTENVDGLDRVLIASAYRGTPAEGGTATTSVERAEVNIWEGGLGVHWEISGSPDENTGSPDHAVDNGGFDENGNRVGYDEFVLFEFADPLYEPKSFMVGWACAFGTDGNDTCEYGGSNDVITLIGTGDILAAYISLLQTGDPGTGFTAEVFDDVTIGTLQSFSNGAKGQYLIIAAAPGTHDVVTSAYQYFDYSGSDSPYDTQSERDIKCVSLHGTGSTASHYDSFNNKFKCNYKETKTKDGSGAFKITQIVGELEPPTEVPEPGLVGLLGLGLAGVALVARRRVAA